MQEKYRKASITGDAAIWNELIDFSNPHLDERIKILHEEEEPLKQGSCTCVSRRKHTITETKPFSRRAPSSCMDSSLYRGPVYGLRDGQYKGFAYLPQALSSQLQCQIATEALEQYCELPHRTNLDTTFQNHSTSSCDHNSFDKNNTSNTTKWSQWKQWNSNTNSAKNKPLLEKVAWSTMGYHYNWTNRSYCDAEQSAIPASLVSLCQTIAKSVKFLLQEEKEIASFQPQACIVNYYNFKSLMGGHADDLEFNWKEPILSLSVGCAAVFLLDGLSKNGKQDPALPILIRPGDVMIMGGNSRLLYHGMARVLPTLPTALLDNNNNDNGICCAIPYLVKHEQSLLDHSFSAHYPARNNENDNTARTCYLDSHRININVRQVLSNGVSSIQQEINQNINW